MSRPGDLAALLAEHAPDTDSDGGACECGFRCYADWDAYYLHVAEVVLKELDARIVRLERWKLEASQLFDGLQDLGRELGVPLGQVVTGPAALAAVRELKARVAERD